MDRLDMAKFMRLNGTITGGRTERRWFPWPRRRVAAGQAGRSTVADSEFARLPLVKRAR